MSKTVKNINTYDSYELLLYFTRDIVYYLNVLSNCIS